TAIEILSRRKISEGIGGVGTRLQIHDTMKATTIKLSIAVLFTGCLLLISSCAGTRNNTNAVEDRWDAVQHLKIYAEDGRFAGWPANNGIWMWGDEILVGFVEAAHRETEG